MKMGFYNLIPLIALSLPFHSVSAFVPSVIEPLSHTLESKCLDSWMALFEEGTDAVDYKDFGEKYCHCMNIDPFIVYPQKATTCLSKTLLHNVMDDLEEEVGFSECEAGDVDEQCQEQWTLVYPKPTEMIKKKTASYCSCIKPMLVELLSEIEHMTDKQSEKVIDAIAVKCM